MKNFDDKQPLIDYITKYLHVLNLIQASRRIDLNRMSNSTQGQNRCSSFQRREYAKTIRITERGENMIGRINTIRNIISTLPSYSLNLHELISKFDVTTYLYYIKSDRQQLLYANNENDTYDIHATNDWNFISGDTEEGGGDYMKFHIRLFGAPRGKMKPAVRKIYEKYVLLKQIGLATGMAALFNERYNKREKKRYYNFTLLNQTTIAAHEYMYKFRDLFEKEPVAKIYREQHVNDSSDAYILDAWSDSFAAYFMGFYLNADQQTSPPSEAFSGVLKEYITHFVYASIARPS